MLVVNRVTQTLVQQYLAALNCPRSLAVWLLYKYGEHEQLLDLEINPNDFIDPSHFRDAYLATHYLSKSTFLHTTYDKKEKALIKWRAAEVKCREINRRGFRYCYKLHSDFEWVHNATQRRIAAVLGDFSPDEMFTLANWGPGVTLTIKRDTSSTNKFRAETGITEKLRDLVACLFPHAYPHWNPDFRIQKGNKIVTVPKTSKIDRVIAIEPGINLWFQKGVGSMIRKRLLRFHVNLNSQKRNQHLAFVSSKYDTLATVDFSSASDTIAKSTVEELLPQSWFEVMDILRSHEGSVEGHPIRYEKFSSMGNGFTFELESLLFYAIAVACCNRIGLSEKMVSVYGDDVILPKQAFDLFQRMCEIYGFSINPQKSFTSGDFRESCGSHYFRGIDCKPYYLRDIVRKETDIYKAANSVRRVSRLFYGCDSRFFDCYSCLIANIHPRKRLYNSVGYGDVGLNENFDLASPSKSRHGIEGFWTLALITIPIGYHSEDHALLLARLKECSMADNPQGFDAEDRTILPLPSRINLGNKTFLRGKVRYVRKKILVRRWEDLGPWL